MPRFPKGSQEAKDYMKSLRDKRGSKPVDPNKPKKLTKRQEKMMTPVDIPLMGSSTLILPEYFATPLANGKYKLVNPMSQERNLSQRNGKLCLRLVRKPVENMVLLEGNDEPIPLGKFSKRDRTIIDNHFQLVDKYSDRPPQEVPTIYHKKPLERGRPEVLKKNIEINKQRGKKPKQPKQPIEQTTQPVAEKQPNLTLNIQEVTKKRGRPTKYETAEEKAMKKREQTLASNKRKIEEKKAFEERHKLPNIPAFQPIDWSKETKTIDIPMTKEEKKELEKQKKENEKKLKQDKNALKRSMKSFVNYNPTKKEREQEKELERQQDILRQENQLKNPQQEVDLSIGRKKKKGVVGIGNGLEQIKHFFFGNEGLPTKVKNMLKKFGNEKIQSIYLIRTPVPKYLTEILNVASLGEFNKKLKEAEYDKLFHLAIVFKTAKGEVLLEKNESINMSEKIPKTEGTEKIDINLSQDITINELLDRTKKYMGDDRFLKYDASNNNCQDFILNVLKANGLGSDKDYEFVKQDTEALFKTSPHLKYLARNITDLASRFTGSGMENYKIQSVIFDKKKYSIDDAKKWLKSNGYLSPKVDETENQLRFRQKDPDVLEEKGFTEYRTKPLGESGIQLIIAYYKPIIKDEK